jgi:hypothetical protein
MQGYVVGIIGTTNSTMFSAFVLAVQHRKASMRNPDESIGMKLLRNGNEHKPSQRQNLLANFRWTLGGNWIIRTRRERCIRIKADTEPVRPAAHFYSVTTGHVLSSQLCSTTCCHVLCFTGNQYLTTRDVAFTSLSRNPYHPLLHRAAPRGTTYTPSLPSSLRAVQQRTILCCAAGSDGGQHHALASMCATSTADQNIDYR